MNRREFIGTVGAGAIAGVGSRTMAREQALDAPADIYARAYAIDAMCFAMEPPPRTFVQYLTNDKIEALRTSGITAMAMKTMVVRLMMISLLIFNLIKVF